MNLLRCGAAFLPACLLVVGCQSPYRANIAMDPGHEVRLSSSTVFIEDSLQPLGTQIKNSKVGQATGGGLLWDLIDISVNSSRQADTQSAAGPIYQALSAISVPAELKKRLETKIGAFHWLGAKTTEVKSAEAIEEIKIDGKTAYTRVAVTPGMDPTFSILTFRLLLETYSQAMGTEGAKRDPLYRFTWDDKVSVIEGSGDVKANAAAWMAGDGKRIKEAYEQGIDQTSDKVLKALSDPTMIPS